MNRVLSGILGSKKDEVRGSGEKYIERSILSCSYN